MDTRLSPSMSIQALTVLISFFPTIQAQSGWPHGGFDQTASSQPPSITDDPGYAPAAPSDTPTSSSSDTQHSDSLLNYYFLLFAILVVVFLACYWSITRKRKAAVVRQQTYQQRALVQDLDDYGWRRVPGRWRVAYRAGRPQTPRLFPEEGLDAHGDAPPPYLKEPAQAHISSRNSSDNGHELRTWTDGQDQSSKPPEYVEQGRSRANDST